jgi:hypothetical protein
MNKEICNKFKSSDIVTVIKKHRLVWLGYVARTDSEMTVKGYLKANQEKRGEKEDIS